MLHHNQKKYQKLLQSVTENLKSYEIVKEYKNNDINKIRLETYRDFIINLCYNIGNTYLGIDFIKTDNQKRNHFKWAFTKVCNEFIEEGIDFTLNEELFDYFFDYFNTTLYENEIYEIEFLLEFWEETLEYSYDKTRVDLEGMIEVYTIFDKTINDKLNVNI